MGTVSKIGRIVAKLAGPCLLLSLPACSSSIGGFTPSASLAYQGPATSTVQKDIRRGLPQQSALSRKDSKSTYSANNGRKAVISAPKLDALAARDMINTYRLARGLKPLYIHPKLTQAAQKHSRDLSKRDEISHYSSDGATPWTRVERTGYRPRVAAENVGTGQTTFREVFKGWKQSPSHNENLLLGDATHMGIALVHRPGAKLKTFWTLVLGSQKEDGVAPVAATTLGRTGG